jgi:hypothetical protein
MPSSTISNSGLRFPRRSPRPSSARRARPAATEFLAAAALAAKLGEPAWLCAKLRALVKTLSASAFEWPLRLNARAKRRPLTLRFERRSLDSINADSRLVDPRLLRPQPSAKRISAFRCAAELAPLRPSFFLSAAILSLPPWLPAFRAKRLSRRILKPAGRLPGRPPAKLWPSAKPRPCSERFAWPLAEI